MDGGLSFIFLQPRQRPMQSLLAVSFLHKSPPTTECCICYSSRACIKDSTRINYPFEDCSSIPNFAFALFGLRRVSFCSQVTDKGSITLAHEASCLTTPVSSLEFSVSCRMVPPSSCFEFRSTSQLRTAPFLDTVGLVQAMSKSGRAMHTHDGTAGSLVLPRSPPFHLQSLAHLVPNNMSFTGPFDRENVNSFRLPPLVSYTNPFSRQ